MQNYRDKFYKVCYFKYEIDKDTKQKVYRKVGETNIFSANVDDEKISFARKAFTHVPNDKSRQADKVTFERLS